MKTHHFIPTILASVTMTLVPLQAAIAATGEIEEIVVTAQKREQSLQDVSVSVTAFTGEDLEKLGFSRAMDMVDYVPNLNVFTIFGEGQQPSLSIRGVGLSSFTDSFEPPVAMYADDVYKGTGVGQSLQMFDLERVEVLRGPQGTLFGRNSTGGLLHLISRKPTDEFEADLSIAYGTDDEITFEGVISGPLSDGIRGRLAVRDYEHDGWADGLDGEDYADADALAVRGILEFDIQDRGQLRLTAARSEFDAKTGSLGITGSLHPDTDARCNVSQMKSGICYSPTGEAFSGVPFTGNSLGGFRPDRVPGRTVAGFGVAPEQEVEATSLAVHFDWSFDGWDLTAIVAREDTEKYYFEDLVIFSDGFTLDAEQLTLELRASGVTDSGMNWVVGAYHFDDEKGMGSFDPTPFFGFTTTGVQDTTSSAIFAQITYPFTETLDLTVGARYTDEEKEIDYSNSFGLVEQRKHDSDATTGRIGLDWHPTDETLLYASYSTGFKSGGFNGQFVFSSAGLNPVDDEELDSIELGLKTTFWDNRARLNTSAFFSDYQDQQITLLAATVGGGVATTLANGGDVEIYGMEVELSLVPIENLTVDVSLAWLESEIQGDVTIRSGGITANIEGNELGVTPNFSYSINATYSIPTNDIGRFDITAGYGWKDDYYYGSSNADEFLVDSYGLLTARIGWTSPSEKITVQVFGENLTDEEYLLLLSNLNSSTVASTWGRLRTVGVELGYKF